MSSPFTSAQPIVAVGLLTQRDVDMLGGSFRRLFPIEQTTDFDELLRRLDACEWQAPEPSRD